MKRLPAVVAILAAAAAACSPTVAASGGKLLVVTTVSPITDIAKNVAGAAATVRGIIPEGVDSHPFEPSPDTAKLLSQADVILLNGLHLEDPTLRLAQSNHRDGAQIFVLGDHAITSDQYLYDFSFPRSGGKPNPHLWMDVSYGIKYAELIRDELIKVDPKNASAYRANTNAYLALLNQLNNGIQ